jgi:hypothetical protein
MRAYKRTYKLFLQNKGSRTRTDITCLKIQKDSRMIIEGNGHLVLRIIFGLRIIKSRRMRWEGHIARKAQQINSILLSKNLEGRYRFGYTGVDRRITLKLIFNG